VALLLAFVAFGCDETPMSVDVSETEIWRLELEQTDDGTTEAAIARRRGTIILNLRLNHTTQPDPVCAEREDPNITTFLASVEVVPSRLQPATTGTASGSWNCFGFSGEVRLDDGTTFALESETLAFEPTNPIDLATGMLANSWTTGTRRGYFLMAPDERFEYEPFDSHLDVRVINRHDDDVDVTLFWIEGDKRWSHHDLEYAYDEWPDLLRAASVPSDQTRSIVFPSQPPAESATGGTPPFGYGIFVRMRVGPRPLSYGFFCLLGPERRYEADLIVNGPEEFECSTGWLGTAALFSNPQRLFLRPGTSDTLAIGTRNLESIAAEGTNPSIVATVASFAQEANTLRGEGRVAVTARSDALAREYGVILTGYSLGLNLDSVVEVVPVEVYELGVTLAPDTLTVAAGTTGTANITLERDGLLGLDVRLSVLDLPAGLLLAPPSFSPSSTDRDSSTIAVRIDPTAPPGTYPLTICATIEADPRERCHPAPLVVVVPEPSERYDLLIATVPSNDTMTRGQEVFFDVLVGSAGGTVATGVAATDQLPAGFTYLRHLASAGTYDPVTGLWEVGTVAAGPFTTLRIYATADSAGSFTNVATLTAGIEGDVNPLNDTDSTTVTVAIPTGYDLEVSKTVDRDTVAAQDTVLFTLTATNHGPTSPLGAAVIDLLPAGMVYASDDGAGSYSAGSGAWSLGIFPVGETRTLRIQAIATATGTNTARILSESAMDTNPANNLASAAVTVR
jgi:uncharacterized repeat protein (TIGR01451 family)